MAEGHFAPHVRRGREVYAERLGALLESARRELPGLVEITHVEAGLQTAAGLVRGDENTIGPTLHVVSRNTAKRRLLSCTHCNELGAEDSPHRAW